MARLKLELLGSFRASLNGQALVENFGAKLQALLAYLAVEAGRPHHRESLAALLWSDQPPEKAQHNLRQSLLVLRKTLGDEANAVPFFTLTSETVQFNLSVQDWLDVSQFTRALEAAQGAGDGRRMNVRLLQQAMQWYRGGFLDQLHLNGGPVFEDWMILQREALDQKAVAILALLAGYHERRGETALARRQLARLLKIAPWDENAHRQQMRLLALDGEWSAAQTQYMICRRYLRDELGVMPSAETLALFEAISRGEAGRAGLGSALPPARHNLPPTSAPLIGREGELDELHALLAEPRQPLITLLGPGGIGKTHLALAFARQQVGQFADGVFVVPLEAASSGEALLHAIADALGLTFPSGEGHQPHSAQRKAQLLAYLRSKSLLLVLDGCECLLAGCAPDCLTLLDEMLNAAPGMVLLVTSRQRLGLRQESLVPLDGLVYPREPLAPSPAWEEYSAVDLFVRCARRVRRDFMPGEAEQAAILQICQMLDGLPLGLELAAAAVWARSCTEIARDLSQSLENLPAAAVNLPERHRSLHSAFAISWRLLPADEQALFSRLSVFAGGFKPEAACHALGASPAQLETLVGRSMLRRAPDGRFSLHQAQIQFASEKLAADPTAAAQAAAAHAGYYAAFLVQRAAELTGPRQTQAVVEIDCESENLRRAWLWLVGAGDGAAVAGCTQGLYLFCMIRSRFREGIDLFSAASQRFPLGSADERVGGIALARLGALYEHVGEYERGRALLETSRTLFERLGEPAELAFCLVTLASLAQRGGAYDASLHLAQDALALSEKTGDVSGQARAQFVVGKAHYRLGNIEAARQTFETSLALGRVAGGPRVLVASLNTLADVLCHLGDYEKARLLFEEALGISRSLGDQFNAAVVLNNIGTIDQVREAYASASALYQQSREICHAIGDQAGEALALSNLGEVAALLGDTAQAKAVTQQALQIGRSLQDHWTILGCLNALGEIALEEGDYAAAHPILVEAVRLAAQTHTLQMLTRALVSLGGVLLKSGQVQPGMESLAAALQHPACQEDCARKGQRWLHEQGLELPTSACTLDEVVAKILS